MTLRSFAAAALLIALAAGPGRAAPGAERRCDVLLNVADKDPAGLNVRDAPGGRVIGVLKARSDWVRVHVVAQAGDWMRIDGATLYTDDLPDGEKMLPSGRGYVSVGKLEIETLGHGAILRATPSANAKVVFTGPQDEDKAPKAQVLGCDGEYLQLRVGGLIGWTRDVCTNQRTTCV